MIIASIGYNNTLVWFPTDEVEIIDTIKILKYHKASGHDNFASDILHLIAENIA